MTSIAVVGCGYLGAVHAACMAEPGHEVVGLEVDLERVASLNDGWAPFHDPGPTTSWRVASRAAG